MYLIKASPWAKPFSIFEKVAWDMLSSWQISFWDLPNLSRYFFNELSGFKIFDNAFRHTQRYALNSFV